MKKILIANRGEIACRIIDSCKKLDFHSIKRVHGQRRFREQ